MLETILKQKNISLYRCAKESGIPYTTLSELVRGKTRIEKSSAETVYRLARTLGVSMEDLISSSIERLDFEIFKSNICHMVKDCGENDFIVTVIENDDIRKYWNKKWYAESFYLLAMLDYLSRINDIPLCTRYSDIRSQSLKEPLYPRDVLMAARLNSELDIREKCVKESIPEFLRFNLVEGDIRNVY